MIAIQAGIFLKRPAWHRYRLTLLKVFLALICFFCTLQDLLYFLQKE